VIRVAIWLLERFLRPEVSASVIGDLIERRERGAFWVFRETTSALWSLHARRRSGDNYLMTFLADLRIAARLLRRAPAFTAVSILTLGLAIGATTAIYSVIEPVLLRALPYPSPERLVFVWERGRDGGRDNIGFLTFRDFINESKTIESAAAMGSWQPTLSGDNPERVSGQRVSWTFFRTLGVRPEIGRDFTSDDDVPFAGTNGVVILSHGLWERRFGGDRGIIGRTISVNDIPYTVVGVMPASFDNVVSPTSQIWRPLGYASQPFTCRTCHHLRMIARIRPTVSMAAAATEIDHIHERMEKAYPDQYASVGALTVPIQAEMTRAIRPALLALAAAVGLVLLIAVANVVNLQLARAVRRQDEFSIRVALGAGRSRLLAQLVTEGLLLATLGGLAGLAVARFSLPLLVAKLPPSLPRLSAIHVSPMALAAVSGIVLLLALVMGLVPARSPAGDLGIGLRSGRRLLGGRNHSLRVGLVVGEIALATLLLVSAGLVSRSLIRLLSVDAGFEPRNLLSLEINSVGNRYATNESVWAYHDRVREAVGALPGVVDVAVANQLPLAGNVDMYGVIDPDNIPANPELVPSGDRYVVSESYFKTMHIPLLRGRLFTNAESPDTSQWVAIVSQGLADKLWPGVDPIGKRIRLGGMKGKDRRIIGLVGDVKHRGLDATTGLQWYAPERQWFADNQEMLIVRTSVDPSSIAGAVRKAISEIDPTQPVVKIATMDQLIATSTAQRRLALVLFAAFAIAALLLAVAGVYGVLAGSVAERTREIGVRSALGATPRNIVGLVVGQGGRLAAIGIAIGLAGSLAVTRYLSSLLFNIQPTDPATLGGVAALLAVVTVAACLIPATRAARVDPSRALRSE
jgi:putative ABC transport system permease protein